ncbi:adenylate/guanylate cyclase domain-containing protein [Reyranella sp.]|uniref:adenylate/guanylate cyclase domain-containing protein n=1 Tax=Reyranella sp. TaxID=1929291 RepID=UPI00378356F4
MKRKVGLFLLAVMVAVSLGATIVASLAMYRLMSQDQAADFHSIEASLSERFALFETMLRTEHQRIVAHMDKVLPEIAAELDASGRTPAELSTAELDALARKYGVQHLYFIGRDYKVFQTNLAHDKGLEFPRGSFRGFLDSVFGAGKVMNDDIDLSQVSGTLRTYSYFGPEGRDYIVEASTDIRTNLAQGPYGWLSKYFFEDLFDDAVDSNPYVKSVDIYLQNDTATWSLINPGKQLDPALAERVIRDGRETIPANNARLVTIYSSEKRQASTSHLMSSKYVIRQITYDTGLARQAVTHVFLSSMLVLALMLPVVYWIASRLLQRQLLDPLFTLRGEAGAIARGNLDQAIANTGRRDEIGQLATSFASMRDSVRRTIVDLRRTNLAIERFVPQAFLSILGKPSIVEVALGDNKHQNMTVLFSDMRDFTTLSEAMTPGQNFTFINAYLERMGPVIRKHRGFIDKYIGDAIMGLFFTADDALSAGLDMLAVLETFNGERRAAGLEPIAIGIGLNSGSLMIGTIGEKNRMDGTVISDTVNLASRVESLTKDYGVGLLISQFTRDELADPTAYDIRPIGSVPVKGRIQPVTLFEVVRGTKEMSRSLRSNDTTTP